MTAKKPAAKKTAAKKATPAKKAAAAPVTPPVTTDPQAVAPPTPDQTVAVEKREAALKLGTPAERRADYVRALEEERSMCSNHGKSDRVKAIDAELDRVKKSPSGRTTAPTDQA